MSSVILLLAICLFIRSALLPAIVAALLAADIYLNFTNASMPISSQLILLLTVLSVPVAVGCTVHLITRFIGPREEKLWGLVASVATISIILSSDHLVDMFESVIAISDTRSGVDIIAIFSGIINRIIMVVSLVAVFVISLALAFELPLRWFSNVSRINLRYASRGLRILTVVFLISIGIDQITRLFVDGLHPQVILELIKKI